MCELNPEYDPEIYMVSHFAGPLIDCYFTNGDVRRYDVTPAIRRGGVYAPLADEEVVKRSLTVYKGTLAFDVKGNADPFEIVDFCPDTVYEKSVSVLPLEQSAQIRLGEEGNEVNAVPRLTTLCYLERDGKYLVLHRTKKEHDENGGK